MKKNIVVVGIVILTIVLGVLSVLTALRVKELGTRPVAPNVPESKPEAQESIPPNITPAPGCKVNFSVTGPTPTGTIIPTLTTTPEPTPTGTIIPTSTVTPTVTTAITPTSTLVPGQSYCDYLQADKTSGLTPLNVNFKGKGYDSTRIKGFRFLFGDGTKKEFFGSFTSSHIQETSFTYTQAGSFKAVLEILDDGDHWRTRQECEVTITTTGVQPTPTKTTFKELESTPTPVYVAQAPTKSPTPTEAELPKAGIKIPTLGAILSGFLLISLGVVLIL